MIETYYHDKEGYNPFLIREGWQVAQLNHVTKHGLADIDQIEVHRAADEVFILFKGVAVLIAAVPDDKDTHKLDCAYLDLTPLQRFVYNN